MKFIILLTLLLTSGCAVGPLVSHETARTVGDRNHEFVAGYGMSSFVGKWNYGLTENLDIGAQIEALSVGVKLKYAFINNRERGWSLAGTGGMGYSIGGDHYYADLSTSYLRNSWEPYTTLRVVHVKTDPLEFKDEDTGEVDFRIDSTRYTYGQYILGLRYWISDRWLVSLEGSSLFAMSSGVGIGSNVLVGAGLGYRF